MRREVREARWLNASARALAAQFLLQVLLGVVLAFRYRADPAGAYASILAMSGTPWGWLRSVHYWGSAALIVQSAVHLGAMIWFGQYVAPNRTRFVAAIGAFLGSLSLQLTGNLLPYDRHGVQSAAIERNLLGRIPGSGEAMGRLLVGDPEAPATILSKWWTLHAIGLPFLVLALGILSVSVHKLRHDPEEPTRGWWLPALAVLVIGALLPAPLASPARPDEWSRTDVRVSWYTWPLHGLLNGVERLDPQAGWIALAGIPALGVLALVALPALGAKVPVTIARGGLGLVCVGAVAAGLGFGGTFAPLVGRRDPPEAKVTQRQLSEPPSVIDRALAAKGRTLFNEDACAGCHGDDGARARSGPRLDGLWRRNPNPIDIAAYIRDPKSVKASSTMPAFPQLDEGDLRAMAEFLRDPKGGGARP